MAAVDRCLNVSDFRSLARKRLPAPIFDFVDGGSEDEATLRRNRGAFGDYALVPRILGDVSMIDPSVQVLGQRVDWPLIVSPTGTPTLLHPDAELGIARAAAATGALYTLSTMASRSIEEVAAVTSAPKIFQLYIFRDREITRDLIKRAKAAGFAALMLTVDIQVSANRERDKRSGMVIPPRFGIGSLADFARHPSWCLGQLRHPMKLANFDGRRAEPGSTLIEFINQQFDPNIRWSDLDWIATEWGGPFAVKGVLHPDDAAKLADHGASAVILSNHGGRQLDNTASPLDMLPRVIDALSGRAEVLLDGGIRRGTDMIKALSLGASACMAGRPGLYGLAAGGTAGVQRVLQLLRTEFERDMALLGARTCEEIGSGNIIRTS